YREGMHNFALRTTDIEALSASLEKSGFKIDGPHTFRREKENGELVSWKLLFIKDNKTNVPMPFIIDWGMSDEERLENLEAGNILGDNGKLLEIKVAVENVDNAIHAFTEAFHLNKLDENTLELGKVILTFTEELQENQV